MKRIILTSGLILAGFVGFVSGQRSKPTVGINADIATYTINGSRVSGTNTKRLTFVNLQYNEVTLPCVLAESSTAAVGYGEAIGGASVSCGWTPEIVAALSTIGK